MFPPRVNLGDKTDRKPLQFQDLLKLNEQVRTSAAQ